MAFEPIPHVFQGDWFVVVAVAVGAAMTLQQFTPKARRRDRSGLGERRHPRTSGPTSPHRLRKTQPDAADQLRIVMGAEFTPQPLLNKSEARLFKELGRIVGERNPEWQVMAQVSLGEILRSDESVAYRCINAKS